MTGKSTPPPVEEPAFHKTAENLYRLESSNGYYALLKRGGKQFRRFHIVAINEKIVNQRKGNASQNSRENLA